MLEICKRIFTLWGENNILYCHWKSNEHLMPGLNGQTDLDILLSESDKVKAFSLLKECKCVECRSQFGSRFRGVTDWIGFDYDTGKLIHIHLHFRLITGNKGLKEFEFPWADYALKTRIVDEVSGVYVMNPNLELITLYARISLKAKKKHLSKAKRGQFKLDEDNQKELDYLKALVDWTVVAELLDKYVPEYKEELLKIYSRETINSNDLLKLNLISHKCFDSTREHGDLYNFALTKGYHILFLIRLLYYRKSDKLFIFKKTVKSKKLISVAFIGQDGSGKSTVSIDILKWFTWKIEARRVYLGSGEHYHSWEKIVLKNLSKYKPALLNPIKCIVATLDYINIARTTRSTLKMAHRYMQNGGIAIFDRYPQNQYYGINDGPKIREALVKRINNPLLKKVLSYWAKKEEKIISASCEKQPMLVFKLMLSPEESLRRKPNEVIETVSRKHEIIKTWQFDSSKVFVIDATMPYEEELLTIKRIIWDSIQE